MMLGSSVGGKLISMGRVKALNMSAIIGMVGVLLTLVHNFKILLIGRVLYGFASGVISVAWPRYMDEVLPPHLISWHGGLYCFSFAIATIIAFVLALGLPLDTDHEALKND